NKARESAQSMDLPLIVVDITKRHLDMIKHPKHGYGSNMNPCIDCHALMFKIAGEILEKEGADFILTGEVLGQRPMSQNKKALAQIANESGLGGLLLRPLSAKRLPVTILEEKGWVKRELLMDFQGRSRKPQMELARTLNIEGYPSPAGGCLLTEKVFSRRLRDLFSSQSNQDLREIELLKLGRHFRISPHAKLVVGRNEGENKKIRTLSGQNDLILISASVPGPTVLLSGSFSNASLELAAAITASYSDGEDSKEIAVRVIGGSEDRMLMTKVHKKEEFKRYMI
ncbi:MAG: tRNA 4-thiouridine(8) synthase ThiI, partial [Desulfobacteraceae bacterium]